MAVIILFHKSTHVQIDEQVQLNIFMTKLRDFRTINNLKLPVKLYGHSVSFITKKYYLILLFSIFYVLLGTLCSVSLSVLPFFHIAPYFVKVRIS